MKTTENKKTGQEPDILLVCFLFEVTEHIHPKQERKKFSKKFLECKTSANIFGEKQGT